MQESKFPGSYFGNERDLNETIKKMKDLSLNVAASTMKKSNMDRFIPNRKLTNYEQLYFENEEVENQLNGKMKEMGEDIENFYKEQILLNAKHNLLNFGANENPAKSILAENSIEVFPKTKSNKFSKAPFKILDAPSLIDDFYLNLIDWSSKDTLAVALGTSLYLWSSATNKVSKLCDTGSHLPITSVAWSKNGGNLSVGNHKGDLQIFDSSTQKLIREYKSQHSMRIGSLAWTSNSLSLLACGSRDRKISIRDIRARTIVQTFSEHKQEVCGLKWSLDDKYLASGGNDNKLLVWSLSSSSAVRKFNRHKAAVKALTWSPHQTSLLVSGGGTADKSICQWNINENKLISQTETDSQVCNLLFAKHSNELISTHGYSQNQINIWKTSEMEKTSVLTGHTSRVLYLAMNPLGDTIVTGAGDETLRFWKIHTPSEKKTKNCSILSGNAIELR